MPPVKLYLSVLCAVCACGSADIYSKLHHFEKLQSSDLNIASRRKRSADGRDTLAKEISFTTLGRNFRLVLTAGSPVLSQAFRAKTVDEHGRAETFHVDPSNFYTGHLADDESVSVEAHYEDGILSSSIRFPDETYVVEPAWRHRNPSENYTMISYRGSDVNWADIYPIDPETGQRTKMKDGIKLDQENSHMERETHEGNSSWTHGQSRHKRASIRKNTCPILVVADYTFFRDMGNLKRQTTASYLITAIQNVNRHFRSTIWDAANGYVGLGFQIDEMLIHTAYTSKKPGHYNYEQNWDYNDKLYAFSDSSHILKFCVAHLFTSYPFAENVLGLAFIAPEGAASAGGVCSIVSQVRGKRVYPRTGFSSAKNTRGHAVLSLQFELVTTHELGHNWGAEHDAETDECAPGGQDGGKYLMWPYAVPGFEENNKIFSPCSIRYVAPVLRSKSDFCFRAEDKNKALCGNGIIERGEECDVGFTEVGETPDPCCDKNCRFTTGSECSDFNHACCRDCRKAGTKVLCGERNNLTCTDNVFCNGKSFDCPQPRRLSDNTECLDKGQCFDGTCLGYCEIYGRKTVGKDMKPCLCSQNTTAMCRRCCAEVTAWGGLGECEPTSAILQEGRTCYIGSCDSNGECEKVERHIAIRIFDFIKHLTADKLVEFMRANLVGTILVLSIIVWVPASWVVSCVDKREISKEKDYLHRWISRENSLMGKTSDLSGFRIKNSRFKKLPVSTSSAEHPPPVQTRSAFPGRAPLATFYDEDDTPV